MFAWLRKWLKIRKIQSPLIESLEEGCIVVKARGCEIVIKEDFYRDMRDRPMTVVSVRESNTDEYLFVRNPRGFGSAIGVVKLKSKRKVKEKCGPDPTIP